jgi:hypothetical protein
MSVVDYKKALRELVYFLRNSDIFTTTQRSVTTDTDSGTFSGDDDHLIDVPNVKNIRSITVDAATLTYGTDYDYDIDFDDSGTIKCKITFTSSQTGDYEISYDYGSDKIFPDFPKPNLTIASFPRIGCGYIDTATEPGGFGNVDLSTLDFTIVVYELKTEDLYDYIYSIRSAIKDAYKSFYYAGKYVHVIGTGPVLKAPEELGKNKVFQQNIDIRGEFNYEK